MDQENEYNDPHYHHEAPSGHEEDKSGPKPNVNKPLADANLENAAQLAMLFTLKWQPPTPNIGTVSRKQKQFRGELNSLLQIVGIAVINSTLAKQDETNKPNPDTPTSS